MWNKNEVQFPRLLSEIFATVEFTKEQREALCESMDLEYEDIQEIFRRAEDEWDSIKEKAFLQSLKG